MPVWTEDSGSTTNYLDKQVDLQAETTYRIKNSSSTDLFTITESSGTVQFIGGINVSNALTIGVDGTGHDVKFYGDTLGKYMEWDQSANQLDVTGSLDVTGNTSMIGTLTVGVDEAGHDVKFFGATSGRYLLWDESEDRLRATDNAYISVGDGNDCSWYHSGTNTLLYNITGDFSVVTTSGTLNIGTLNSRPVLIGDTTSEVTIGDNLTVTGTLTLGSGAVLAESELELLDDITPGTAAASKALVLDSSKDIGTIRNLTIDGTFSDGNYTFDTSGNVTGLGNVTMTGDLTVSGTSTLTGLVTASAGIKLGNNIIYTSIGGTAITLDTDGGSTFQEDVTVSGDLILSGNKITFGYGATIEDENGYIRIEDTTDSDHYFMVLDSTSSNTDSSIAFAEGNTVKWNIGNDGNASDSLKMSTNSAASLSTDTKLTLTSGGDLDVEGTVNGIDIGARDAILTSTTTIANDAMPKTGGAFTGVVTLAATPIADLGAATKAYVDARLPLIGGTMSGDITMGTDDKVIFGHLGEYIVGDGTDLDIVSSNDLTLDTGGDIILDAASGITHFYDAGDTDDAFKIQVVGGTGRTVLSTVSDAADGHLIVASDGYVQFDGCGVGFDKEITIFAANSLVAGTGDTTNVDFRIGNKQELELTDDIGGSGEDLVMIFPATSGNFIFVLRQDSSGSQTIAADAWRAYAHDLSEGDNTLSTNGTDGDIRWAGGSAPTLSTGARTIDVISIYWDADNQTALAMASLGFAT